MIDVDLCVAVEFLAEEGNDVSVKYIHHLEICIADSYDDDAQRQGRPGHD